MTRQVSRWEVERTLVLGSMEVYRLKGYGAVEIGVHRFHQAGHPEDRGAKLSLLRSGRTRTVHGR